MVEPGDYFAANGLRVRIASVNSPTSITLAYGWPGSALASADYEVQFTPDITRVLATSNAVLQALNSGNVSALAALTTSANKLAYYTGAGVAALTDLSAEARSVLGTAALARGSVYAPYDAINSSANAVVVTTGLPAPSLGQRIRTRIGVTNTGAATLNGLPIRTVRLTLLPAGYLRTDVLTELRYEGSYWVADREPEYGTNANGEYWRYADGRQVCSRSSTFTLSTTAVGSLFSASLGVWAYPIAFAATPAVSVIARGIRVWGGTGAPNATQLGEIIIWSAISLSSASVPVDLLAEGKWY